MAISIRNPRVENLAREIGEIENLSMTDAIIEALEEKRLRCADTSASENLRLEKIREIADRCANLPSADSRTADEILGYNESGGF